MALYSFRGNQKFQNNKSIQQVQRQHLIDGNGTHFITFTFGTLINAQGVSTPFNRTDTTFASELIGEWTWRMDRRFLGGKASSKPFTQRMRFVAVPEITGENGDTVPLHYHAIYKVDCQHWDLLESKGNDVWNKLMIENTGSPARAYGNKGLEIRRISSVKPIHYSIKQGGKEWNWNNIIDHSQFHPNKLPI
ncbi:hypothetical protein JCM17960_34760 [Magnetospira thiophila]